MTKRSIFLFLVSALCARAGLSQTISYPPNGTTTASERVAVTITVPAGMPQINVEVLGAHATPLYRRVLRGLAPGNTIRLVPLAPDTSNTIIVSDFANPANRNSITITQDGNESDQRGQWEASGFVGVSIDSFAANETKNYLGYNQLGTTAGENLQQASGPQTGYTAGVDFSYRLFKSANLRFPLQLWLYGETVHGQRSTEVDCTAAPDTCKLFDPTTFDPTKLASTFFAILRNSTTLEGYAGARLEFLKLNPGSDNSANLYVKSQVGFITVQKNGGDIVDDHLKIGVGAIMTSGLFKHSYLEAGYGKSDLFAFHRGRRFKVDGYLEWQLPGSTRFSKAVSPFLQLTVDSDFGRGSDSIRTYYGLNFDIKELFK